MHPTVKTVDDGVACFDKKSLVFGITITHSFNCGKLRRLWFIYFVRIIFLKPLSQKVESQFQQRQMPIYSFPMCQN